MSWSPARRRLALYALLAAAVTGALTTTSDTSGAAMFWLSAHVGIAAVAVVAPAAIALQVLVGLCLVGRALLGAPDPPLLLVVPAIAGVVATAELLAVVARLDTTLRREPADALGRAARASAIAGLTFVAVTYLAALPGPTGLLAVGLASGACWWVATRLVGSPPPVR